MKISIQVCLINGWDNNNPVLHDVKDWDAAINLAYAMSHQFGNTTVRLVKIPDAITPEEISLKLIGAISGTYIQSTEPNIAYVKASLQHKLVHYF